MYIAKHFATKLQTVAIYVVVNKLLCTDPRGPWWDSVQPLLISRSKSMGPAVLRMKPQKPGPRVTPGLAR